MALDRTEIADQLREAITSDRYSPGDKLPPRRELAKELGAAPNTVGEAIKILVSEGLVSLKRNSRAEVLDPMAASANPEVHVRQELTEIHAELRHLSAQLSDLDDRLAELVKHIDTDQPSS